MFQQSTSLFGNQNQSTGSSLFSQQQPQIQGQGLFGQQNAGFQPQNQPTGLFGQAQPQNQPTQQNSLFGGGTSTGFGALGQPSFNQSVISTGGSGGLFGQQQQQQPTFGGNAPVNQNQFGGGGIGGGTFSTFSQAVNTNQQQQSGFNAFGQSSGNNFGGGLLGSNMGGGLNLGQNMGGGGLFNQNQNTGGGLFGNQNKSLNPQDQNQNQIQGPSFYQIPQQQTVHSMNTYFDKKDITQQEQKGNSITQCFHSLRIEPQFSCISSQMLKLLDIIAMKTQQPQTSYEFLAQNEYKQNPQVYPLQQKLLALSSGINTQTQPSFGNNQGGGLFNQKNQNQNFLGGQNNAFNTFQQPQQQNQGILFGNKSQGMNQGFNGNLGQMQNQPTSLFGNNQQQQQQPLANNAGGLFGNQQKPVGLFGQQQPNQFGTNTNQLGAFQSPQQNTQTNTLFGQNNNNAGLNLGLNQGTQSQGLFGAKPLGGGGLFQNQQQAQPLSGTPGLFGNQQQQPQQNQGTSLFGNQQQQTQQPLGLFGNQPQQQQQPQQQPGGLFQNALGTTQIGANPGGIFGNNQQAQTTQPSTGTGLFGNTQTTLTANPGSSLFKPQQTSSLFQQPTQQQPSSLFTQNQQPSIGGGLFQNNTQPGSLFNSQPLQQQQQPNSLFTNQQSAQSSLFSQNPSFTGSLSATSQPSLQSNRDMMNQLYTMQRDIYGVENSFLTKESPFAKVDEDLKKIIENSEKLSKDPAYNVYLQNKGTQNFEKYLRELPTESGPSDITPEIYSSRQFLAQRTPMFDSELINEQEYIKKQLRDKHKNEQQQLYSQLQKESFNAHGETGQNKTFFINNNTRFEPRLTKSIYSTQSTKIIKEDQQERPVKSQSDVLVLDVIVAEGNQEISKQFKIHKTRTVTELCDSIQKWLTDEKLFDPKSQQFKILYKNQLLKNKVSLKDAQLQENAKLYALIDDIETQQDTTQGKQNAQREENPTKPQKKVYTQEEEKKLRPKAPKEGYWTAPDFKEIRKMSIEELKKVQDFAIENEFGKIEFFGETDLTEVDLADIIDIGHMYAEAYNDENVNTVKPPQGQKLNKPSLITLKNVFLQPGQSVNDKERQLRQALAGTDAEYISYEQKKAEWRFKVNHYTRYGLIQSQEEQNDREVNMNDQADQQSENQEDQQDQQKMNDFNPDQLYKSQINQGDQLGQKSISVPHKQVGSLTSIKSVEGSIKQPLKKLPSQQQDQVSERMSQASKRQLNEIDLSIRSQEVIFDSDKNLRFQKISMAQRKLDLDKIISSKQQKLEEISKMDDNYLNLTNEDVSSFLNKLGVRTVQRTNLQNNGGRRVCFRNDGSFVSINNQNKIILIKNKNEPTEIINKEILQKHFTIEPREQEVERDIISRQMMQMNLQQRRQVKQQNQIGEDNSMQIDQQNKPLINSQFEDPYFGNLFSKIQMPFTSFNATPNTIFKFLYDLSKNYISDIQSSKVIKVTHSLQNEFYMVCLLNALFGNPHIHLIQLHKAFKGLINIDQKLNYFKQNEFVDGHSFEISKIRRNAVTEIVRFICKNEFPVTERNQNIDQIYDTALAYLLNGDISGAVKFLNNNNKVKMALTISQAINNQTSIELLKQQLNQQMYSKLNPQVKNIISFLTGQYQFSQSQKTDKSWLQALCYHLLIRAPANIGLKEVLSEFHKDIYQRSFEYLQLTRKIHQVEVQETPLLYLYMKIYANIDQESSLIQLNQFYNVDNEISQNRLSRQHQQLPNLKVQWLTQIVFRQLSEYYFKEKKKYENYYSQILIEDVHFTRTTTNLIHELLLNKDWLGAIFISQFIPQSYQHIQKQITFHILQKNSLALLNISDLDLYRKTVLTDYKVPQKLFYCARGILFEYQQYYERAIKDWLEAKNFERVHTIFLEKIIPNYFHLEFNQARVLKFLKGNKEQLQLMTFELKKVHPALREWLHRANMIEIFLNFVEKSSKDENQNDVIRIKTYSEAKQIKNKVVNDFIQEQLSNWDFKRSAKNFNQEIFKKQNEDVLSQ